MRELTYLDPTTVQAVKRTTNTLRYGMARDGYTLASGAPMPYMLRIRNHWHRLMVWQFSNAGSLFVRILGKPHHVREEEIDELPDGAIKLYTAAAVEKFFRKAITWPDMEATS